MWDAAYVLGALSPSDRSRYEAHLGTCSSCREAVSELSGMPALLAKLDRDEVAAIDDGHASSDLPPLRPSLLTSLLAKVSRRRRRSWIMAWTAASVAAVVLAIGVFVALQPNPRIPSAGPPQPQASALTMTRLTPDAPVATVRVDGHGWGTRIEMTCTYRESGENGAQDADDSAGDALAMVVVGRDGHSAQLATWVALPGVTATPAGTTSMTVNQIASVQVVSIATGDVVLQRNL